MSIRKKIVLVMLVVTLLSSLTITVYTIYKFHDINEKITATISDMGARVAETSMLASDIQATERLVETTDRGADFVETKLQEAVGYVKAMAEVMTNIYSHPDEYPPRTVMGPEREQRELAVQLLLAPNPADKETLSSEIGLAANVNDLLFQVYRQDKAVIGAKVSTETGFTIVADRLSSRKFSTSQSNTPDTYYAAELDWYQKAKAAGALVFSDVFDDPSYGGKTVVVAAPFYNRSRFAGVAAVTYSLTDLNITVDRIHSGKTGFSFVLDGKGRVVLSPKLAGDVAVLAGGPLTDLANGANSDLIKLARRMMAGEIDVAQASIDGQDYYVAFRRLTLLPWSYASAMEVEEVRRPPLAIQGRIKTMVTQNQNYLQDEIAATTYFFIGAVVAALILALILGSALSTRLVEPLMQLTKWADEISQGRLHTRLSVATGDEIEIVANAFGKMQKELREYIHNLAKVTSDRERISVELNVAQKIQVGFLPCAFPAFPDRTEFDLFARMTPAREVGGDFYDFFLVDADHLAVVICDVSGKGVPAALFMVNVKTLIKNQAQLGLPPDKILDAVNNTLCQSNDAEMFATAFVGILNIEKRRLYYSNAGHNPPLVSLDGTSYDWLNPDPGFILAAMENIEYRREYIDLPSGAVLLLYTDGVTEAFNTREMMYSDDRLLRCANSGALDGATAEQIVTLVEKDVHEFIKGAEPTDDLTILALKIN